MEAPRERMHVAYMQGKVAPVISHESCCGSELISDIYDCFKKVNTAATIRTLKGRSFNTNHSTVGHECFSPFYLRSLSWLAVVCNFRAITMLPRETSRPRVLTGKSPARTLTLQSPKTFSLYRVTIDSGRSSHLFLKPAVLCEHM